MVKKARSRSGTRRHEKSNLDIQPCWVMLAHAMVLLAGFVLLTVMPIAAANKLRLGGVFPTRDPQRTAATILAAQVINDKSDGNVGTYSSWGFFEGFFFYYYYF